MGRASMMESIAGNQKKDMLRKQHLIIGREDKHGICIVIVKRLTPEGVGKMRI